MNALHRTSWIFLIVGLGLLGIAGFLAVQTQGFLAQAERTTGTVVDLVWKQSSDSSNYKPEVEWTAPDGSAHRFISSVGSNPPSYQRGQTVEVFYQPGKPESAKLGGFFPLWGGVLVCGLLGLVFSATGGGLIFSGVRKKRLREFLALQGVTVPTQFVEVIHRTGFKVNGRSPWRIISQWQDPATGLIHTFQSDDIWYDPTEHIGGSTISVSIDPHNPKRHDMDTSFLPRQA
jgi:hypothetical protein